MSQKYYPAAYDKNEFHCVHCGVFATQSWGWLTIANHFTDLKYCFCGHCKEKSYWHEPTQRMILPDHSTAPPRHVDLPASCHSEYDEARAVLGRSPRAAAALLRLVIQKLMIALGETGKNINDDIASLVKKGLPIEVQQSLDICRVVGNNAVHPGEIILNETPKIADSIFGLINFIVEDRITKPKNVAALYAFLPEKDRLNIQERNKKATGNK